MQVGQIINITKDQFLRLAKMGLVLSDGDIFYRYISDINFRGTLGRGGILGYVFSYHKSGPNYQDHICGLWSRFNGNSGFKVVTLPKQPLYKAR